MLFLNLKVYFQNSIKGILIMNWCNQSSLLHPTQQKVLMVGVLPGKHGRTNLKMNLKDIMKLTCVQNILQDHF